MINGFYLKVFSVEDSIIIKKLGAIETTDFETAETMFNAVFQ
jgi:hypothetical protein